MSSLNLVRWGALAAMLGGALYLAILGANVLIYDLFMEQAKGTFFGEHAFIQMLDVPAFALLLIGTVGVYLRQSGRLGKVGKAGFYLTVAGFGLSVVGGLTIIAVGLTVSDEATLGILDVVTHPLAMFLYSVGSLIFGIATFRAGVLPRGAALLMASGPIWLFTMMMSGLVGPDRPLVLPLVPWAATALGWAWLGYALHSEREEIAAEPLHTVR
jgi:hypothetical protein